MDFIASVPAGVLRLVNYLLLGMSQLLFVAMALRLGVSDARKAATG